VSTDPNGLGHVVTLDPVGLLKGRYGLGNASDTGYGSHGHSERSDCLYKHLLLSLIDHRWFLDEPG
jgi:hypothetical protein